MSPSPMFPSPAFTVTNDHFLAREEYYSGAEGVAPANGHTVATDSSPANSVVRWCADSITGNLTVVVWIGTQRIRWMPTESRRR